MSQRLRLLLAVLGACAVASATIYASRSLGGHRTAEPRACGVNGTFQSVASTMQTHRFGAATALLDDGRVLLAGNFQFDRSAEIFSPVTGMFSPTGSMNQGRCYGCGTAKLQDGRVVVGGGWNGGAVLSSAETYDPNTGAFTLVPGSMSDIRLGPGTALLPNGMVLFAFGHPGCCHGQRSADLFDPSTGLFTPTGTPQLGRLPGSAQLADGRVLFFGGQGDDGHTYITLGEIYDPADGQFHVTGSLNGERHGASRVLLDDGRVMIAGGLTNSATAVASTEFFNPVTGMFTVGPSMLQGRIGHAMILTAGGQILIIGGSNAAGTALASTEVFDPATNAFSAGPFLTTARDGASVLVLQDQRILVASGFQGPTPLRTAEIYSCPASDTTPPSVNCAVPDGVWHSGDVSLQCTASDAGGLAQPEDSLFLLATNVPPGLETTNAVSGSHTVCDVSGNCTTAGPISGNMIDKRPPAISLVSPMPATLTVGQSVTASYSCTDGGSGMSTCVGPVASGAPVPTNAVGTQTFQVQATDAAGNSATTSVTYAVAYGVCPLFGQAAAHKAGSTVPIKLRICDAAGANLSSASVPLVATSVFLISTNAPGPLEDSGASNPDNQFRFAADSYIFNLSLKGFAQGTYGLSFRAGADLTVHTVQFQVK